ncbi:hypothetical protein [Streptomyces roseolilacinus]|uniref:hypothetical protein n=1 Tax=Streptomyces roseolilacinus TaxID=66904 RepID=UPI0037FF8BBC
MGRLGWVNPAETVQVAFGTSRAGAVDVALYRAAGIDALVQEHPEAGWERRHSERTGSSAGSTPPASGCAAASTKY